MRLTKFQIKRRVKIVIILVVIFFPLLFRWECCWGNGYWCRFRDKLLDFVHSSTAEMITVTLVVLNTLFMASEHEPKSDEFKDVTFYSNLVRF